MEKEAEDFLFDVIEDVREELENSFEKHKQPCFVSPHEGYAVLLEEVDELWDEVKANKGRADEAYNEAKQVAAMAIKYMLSMHMGWRQ